MKRERLGRKGIVKKHETGAVGGGGWGVGGGGERDRVVDGQGEREKQVRRTKRG